MQLNITINNVSEELHTTLMFGVRIVHNPTLSLNIISILIIFPTIRRPPPRCVLVREASGNDMRSSSKHYILIQMRAVWEN